MYEWVSESVSRYLLYLAFIRVLYTIFAVRMQTNCIWVYGPQSEILTGSEVEIYCETFR